MPTDPIVFDQSLDLSGAEQYRLTSLFLPPGYVKEASHDQLCGDAEALPPHVYAIPGRRLYPCHTKAATWMSALFFGNKQASLAAHQQEVGKTAILAAAGHFGILPQVEELLNKIATAGDVSAVVEPDSAYALVWTDDAGQKYRRYPIRNGEEVKVASAYFAKHRDEFVYGDRRRIATKILEKAADFSQPLPEAEMLARSAGFGYSAGTTMADAWQKRATLLKSSAPEFSREAGIMAERIRTNPPGSRDPDVMEKMAGLLDDFDRHPATKLVQLYDKGLERPEDTLYQITEKTASDFVAQHVELVTGSVYAKDTLGQLKLATIREWLGDEVGNAVKTPSGAVDIEKLADVASVLPRPDAAMFDRMAAACSIEPRVVQKAAAFQGLTPDELKDLSAAYHESKKVLQTTL